MPSSLSDYRAALTTPRAAGPVVTSLLGRLPIAWIGLSMLLYVQHETGTFATAGLVSATELTGVAIGSVVQGRVMDRVGPSWPLAVMSGIFAITATGEIAAIEAHAPTAILVLLALLVGFSEPVVPPASRSLWSQLVPSGPIRDAALSYEAISMEVFFILGPGIAGLMALLPWPGTGVAAGVTCMIVGSLGLAATRAARGQRPHPHERPSGSPLGALASPGMRTVALAAFGFGTAVGSLEVGIPAAAAIAGHPSAGGLLLSLLSISSVFVGVLYSARPWPRPLRLRLPVLLLGFAALISLLALPRDLGMLALCLLLAGSLITPQSTTHSMALDVAAPAGTATESFGWIVTAVTLGSAIGQSLSGQLVELAAGPSLAFLAAGALGAVFAGVLWLRRHTLPLNSASTELSPTLT